MLRSISLRRLACQRRCSQPAIPICGRETPLGAGLWSLLVVAVFAQVEAQRFAIGRMLQELRKSLTWACVCSSMPIRLTCRVIDSPRTES